MRRGSRVAVALAALAAAAVACAPVADIEPDDLAVTASLTLTAPGELAWDDAVEFRRRHGVSPPRDDAAAAAVLDVRWRLDPRPQLGPGGPEGELAFFVLGPGPYRPFPGRAVTDAPGGGIFGAHGGVLADLTDQHPFLEPFAVDNPDGTFSMVSYYSVDAVEQGRALWMFTEDPKDPDDPDERGELRSGAGALTLAVGHTDRAVGHWAVEMPIEVRGG